VSLLCIKRLQKLQNMLENFYNLQLHIFMQKEDFSLNRVKDPIPTKSYNGLTSMFIGSVIDVIKAFDNNQWPLN
jgi:conjugal transfer/entry exclusion protein